MILTVFAGNTSVMWVEPYCGKAHQNNLSHLGKWWQNLGTYRGKHSIKMGLEEIGWEGVDWTFLGWNEDKWWEIVNTY